MTKADYLVFSLCVAAEEKGYSHKWVRNLAQEISDADGDILIFMETSLAAALSPAEKEILLFLKNNPSLAEDKADELARKKVDIISFLNPQYPENIKRKLKDKAPLVFYSIGSLELINKKAVAVVGPRDCTEKDIEYAKKIGEKCAKENLVLVSGGANGVDSVAQETALLFGGRGICYVSMGFEASGFVRRNRKYIEGGNLLCLSAENQAKPFSKGYALERNKYIHSHGDISVTVRAKYKKGGSWAGSADNILNGRTRALVCDISSPGNEALAEMGAEVITFEKISTPSFSLKKHIEES